MHFASALALFAAESEHTEHVALDTLPYGIVAMAVFAVLAMVVASYRNVANRHADPAEHSDEKH
ncbi:hypothetical protein [Microbacterium sp. G2-8]|uniref:hypothetical protein n=1 Tax=Microbacterium sp. G2-8 TaxID=2842454 RepID=UPI001C8974CF|nr:hypothetical protein [Microbacterium sp. G2-8]